MPNYIRWREQGATYFFTLVTYQRRPLFNNDKSCKLLCRSFASVRRRRRFNLPAYVLLPDHLHCIMTLPENDDDFPTRWRQIKSRFTHDYLAAGGTQSTITMSMKQESRKAIWQPRYWEHRIRNEADYYQHRDYIHLNPVNHGHATNPENWKWTSFHHHVRTGALDPNWPGATPIALPKVPE
jgi:putative transposase